MNAVIVIVALVLAAAQPQPAAQPQSVAQQQAQARERMQEVERRLLELADTLQPQDPARAQALRQALALSRQQFVVTNMGQAQSQLQSGNYGAAVQAEQQVLAALQQLGGILSAQTGGPSTEALQAAQQRLAELTKRQADAVRRTQQSPDADALRAAAKEQQSIAADLKALLDSLQGAPPSGDLNAALGKMSDAQAALNAGKKADALSAQTAAQQHLEAAAEQLQAAIAARRKAEQSQARAGMLAALRRMLEEQRSVTAQTADLQSQTASGPTGRAYRLRARALADRETALQKSAADALVIVVRDGSTVALPAALRQIGTDLGECARMLADGRTGPPVAGLQKGVEAALAALIDAFQAAQQEQAQQPQSPQREGRKSPKQPLVGQAAQLKVLRAMQLALNARTAAPDADAAQLVDPQGALADAAHALRADQPADGMDRAEGLLAEGQTGEPVQSIQRDVVSQLDALIASAEAQQRRAQAVAAKQAQQPGNQTSQQTPLRAAAQSTLPPGDWRQGRVAPTSRLPGDWAASLPPTEQRKIADTFRTGRLPARYEQMLREYNKRLAQQP